MEEEYNKTILLLKKQKEIILESILNKKADIKLNNESMKIIYEIDEKMKEYYAKLNEINNKKIKESNFILTEKINKSKNYDNMENKIKNIEQEEPEEDTNNIKDENIKKINNQNKEDKNFKININLDNDIINNIEKENGKCNIKILMPQTNIEIIYTYQSKSKNFYFYRCSKRPICNGTSKYNIQTKKFTITKSCKLNKNHNKLSFELFKALANKNEFNLIDFTIKKNQTNLIQYIYSNAENVENINIKKEYLKYTRIRLLINYKELSKIKCDIIGQFRGLSLIDCIKKIKSSEFEIDTLSQDIIYEIKSNKANKNITRKQTIIIFGNKDNLNLLKDANYYEFFVDVTFKIIPKCYKPYKLLSLASIDNNNNKTKIICFVFIKYLDSITYERVFKYLNDNYKFNPRIIHSDFENAINVAIKNSNFFKYSIIHVKCFFHFTKSIKDKLNKLGLYKKYNNKEIFTIIKMVQLICFLNIERIDDYKLFLVNELVKLKKYNKFIKYLKTYWFKKNNEEYNFSMFIKKYCKDENKLEKLYFTNNIIEAIHGKINFYLPKRATKIYDFVNAMTKLFLDDSINNTKIKRYDYISKSLLLLMENENFNSNFNWIDYEIFIDYIKKVTKGYSINIDNYNLNNNLDLQLNVINNNNENKNAINKSNNKKDNIRKIISNKLNNCEIFNIVGLKNLGLIKNLNDNNNKIFYCPKNFIKNYNTNNRFIINEQNDVYEFMMDLFDKFQKGLKNTKNEDLIKYFFEFVILNEYKLNCQHKIIKNEFLFTLELEVDNHNNINNSLKYLFDYKNLDNENLIYCSICKKKNER